MNLAGKPLNGEKNHPLSDHAKKVLRGLYREPRPTHEVNPGVVNRLTVGAYAVIERRSNASSRKGSNWLVITDLGRQLVDRNFEGET